MSAPSKASWSALYRRVPVFSRWPESLASDNDIAFSEFVARQCSRQGQLLRTLAPWAPTNGSSGNCENRLLEPTAMELKAADRESHCGILGQLGRPIHRTIS